MRHPVRRHVERGLRREAGSRSRARSRHRNRAPNLTTVVLTDEVEAVRQLAGSSLVAIQKARRSEKRSAGRYIRAPARVSFDGVSASDFFFLAAGFGAGATGVGGSIAGEAMTSAPLPGASRSNEAGRVVVVAGLVRGRLPQPAPWPIVHVLVVSRRRRCRSGPRPTRGGLPTIVVDAVAARAVLVLARLRRASLPSGSARACSWSTRRNADRGSS